MKFLHTSDWHVGKTLQGRSRLDEQEAVLTEIVGLAEQHQVDAVLIAGDLYDTSAPSADAQRILIKTLLALAGTGAQVIAMAGNHDSPAMLDAYRPLARHAGITLLGQPRAADRGGVVTFTARSTGETMSWQFYVDYADEAYAVLSDDFLSKNKTPAGFNLPQLKQDLAEIGKVPAIRAAISSRR